MARPEPEIILSADDFESIWEVIAPDNMWAITLDGELISLRRRSYQDLIQRFKYPKTVFPTEAIARNWAAKLNLIFDTDRFGYCALSAVKYVNNTEVN